jgi:transcription elongation factor GreA-like protein
LLDILAAIEKHVIKYRVVEPKISFVSSFLGAAKPIAVPDSLIRYLENYLFDLSDRIKIIRIHKNFFSNFFKSVVHRKEPELIISAPGGNLISAPRLGTTLVKEVKNMELFFKKFLRIFDKIKRIKIFPTDVGIHN